MYSLLKYKYLIIYQLLQIQDMMMLAQLGRLLGLTMPPCQALQPLQSHVNVPNTGYRHSTGAFARTGGRMDELITPIILGWNI